ncbi:MAG: methyltransferase domain-containing protein [Deltaproteobacteria bacterium]|nr:methyltransferase domain-containing protein [Deltaproteobacteria bacterium]
MTQALPVETADNFEYIHRPLTQARREKFLQVVSRVRGGRVLDLGCGYTGHYWAMAYLNRATSISLYDAVEENIAQQLQTIEQLTPEYIETYLGETVQFLKANKLLPTDWDNARIASSLIQMMEEVSVFDFSKDEPTQTFDCVLALESIEIAASREELLRSCATTRALLQKGGQLVGLALPYETLLPSTLEAVALRREGLLNPNMTEFSSALSANGFEITHLHEYETGTPNYPRGIAFEALAV